jgi:hypothetical protein
LGNSHGIALALDVLARAAQAKVDSDRSAKLFAESLGVSRDVGDRGLAADSLMGLSDVLSRRGDAERAVRLLATGCALQASAGRVESEWAERRDAIAAITRATLGDSAFEAAWQAGRILSWHDAIAEELATV